MEITEEKWEAGSECSACSKGSDKRNEGSELLIEPVNEEPVSDEDDELNSPNEIHKLQICETSRFTQGTGLDEIRD